jgi:hypothetical protein
MAWMAMRSRRQRLVVLLLGMVVAANVRSMATDPVDQSIRQFLAQDEGLHQYRAIRRLEAENGSRRGWLEVVTEYSPETGFRYETTAEGGSDYIRDKVLRAVLDGERDLIAQGEASRFALAPSNYLFQPNGVDADGLANVLLSPRRKAPVLVTGTMFLQPADGDLVRLQGRLVKNPSVWVKNVDIIRTYERIGGAVVPTAFESTAQLRLLGQATLRMNYVYSEIDGRPVTPDAQPLSAGDESHR